MRSFAPNLDEPLEVTREARNYNAWLYGRARAALGGRVLDVGAGIGTFTALASDDGREVVALEPHGEYAELLARELGSRPNVSVFGGTLEELLASSPPPFDSVLCFNVLEHIEDDGRALRAMRDLLQPGGKLFLLVPAHELLFGDVDAAIGHFRRYSKRPLGRLLSAAGLEIETLRYVNPVGALGWLVTFRLRKPPKRWPRGQYRVFDRLVPALRRVDALPLPFGLSVWAVGRRGDRSAAEVRVLAQPEDAQEERREDALDSQRGERQPEQPALRV